MSVEDGASSSSQDVPAVPQQADEKTTTTTTSKTPASKADDRLRIGDLVRISETKCSGLQTPNKNQQEQFGHIAHVAHDNIYTVDCIDGGKLTGIRPEHLTIATTDQVAGRRNGRKRKPPRSFMDEVTRYDAAKKKKRQEKENTRLAAARAKLAAKAAKAKKSAAKMIFKKTKLPMAKKKVVKSKVAAPKKTAPTKKKAATTAKKTTASASTKAHNNSKEVVHKKKRKLPEPPAAAAAVAAATKQQHQQHQPTALPAGKSLYEKHRREFERYLSRTLEKVDAYGYFFDDAPPEYDETLLPPAATPPTASEKSAQSPDDAMKVVVVVVVDAYTNESNKSTLKGEEKKEVAKHETSVTSACKKDTQTKGHRAEKLFPAHPPFNWKMVRHRMELGRYELDREKEEEDRRFQELGQYYQTLGKKRPRKKALTGKPTRRVLHPKGVNWDLFRDDVLGMCDAAIARDPDPVLRNSLTNAAKKIKENLLKTYEKTGRRHMEEMAAADDRHKFGSAIEKTKNTEAAMQSWRKEPFPERRYKRLSKDAVCEGLSKVDERIATYELRTNLPDSFVGISYRYDDTGQSEDWMKSVVDETAGSNDQSKDQARQAALALAADDGVTRAQVVATMQSLLIGVQDKVLTERGVLHQPELRSANWEESRGDPENGTRAAEKSTENNKIGLTQPPTISRDSTPPSKAADVSQKPSKATEKSPDIVEQPVWGMDCYTRRNITVCLRIDFDEDTILTFIQKWLLPAINACPVELAQDISNAARLLEGLPFGAPGDHVESENTKAPGTSETDVNWSQTLLGAAMRRKIKLSAPFWLKEAASQLRRARAALGPDFFRIHPKGHGSVLLNPTVPANRLVTLYRGELYPSWRWGEKMDAIELTQKRKDLKPALPDFYNMALERPQTDPRGYGLLFVDASRKAGHGSSLSHSCDPTCEVRVAARNGELCLAMTTLRELEMGEELTFDYHAVTESLNEYQSAVCLCGHGKCRGSFLHYATAECYQQVLNRNAPIATRFSNLVKRSMKQVMSEDDARVLHNHGFHTAAFGAISVNRREAPRSNGESDGLLDSINIVPVWLKTYVADTLRYIEYERRALPISLICDHLSKFKDKKPGSVSSSKNPTSSKKPGREPSFFYFARVERDFFRSLLRQQGFPESANGLELKHAMLRVASAYWKDLPELKKQYWKSRADAEFQKKMEAWLAGQQQTDEKSPAIEKKSKKRGDKKRKSEIGDMLFSSKISFQDADAEGVSAMEQRIQQLTQTLSRVGRVLDRHREGSLEGEDHCTDADVGPSSLRDLAHSPLRLLPDNEVVGWMWNSSSGVVAALLRQVKNSKCARPSLALRLSELRTEKYGFLEKFGDPTVSTFLKTAKSTNGMEGRRELSTALLDMRKILIDELKELAKEFRRYRAQAKAKKTETEENKKADDEDATAATNEDSGEDGEVAEEGNEGDAESRKDESVVSDDRGDCDCAEDFAMPPQHTVGPHLENGSVLSSDVAHNDSDKTRQVPHEEMQASEASNVPNTIKSLDAKGESGNERTETDMSVLSPSSSNRKVVLAVVDELLDRVAECAAKAEALLPSNVSEETETASAVTVAAAESRLNSAITTAVTESRSEGKDKNSMVSLQSHPWLEYYSQRFALQVSADALLFYAHTTNFFALRPYQVLESTPVDVYAREIGNSVPRSIVDDSIVKDLPSQQLSDWAPDELKGMRRRAPLAMKACPPGPPLSTCEVSQSDPPAGSSPALVDKATEEKTRQVEDTEEGICQPDDIVASVSVRYQGDYVLSQLLQWYNGGIGQKPGLPDLLGCTVLPSMEGIWSSSLLEGKQLRPERKTSYESKIRPRLVEWLQDPYQRGNPWPDEVRQAFEQTGDDLLRLEDSSLRFQVFGSPITDFLIEGDESNIFRIRKELDADDTVSSKNKSNSILTSLDRGRPAQAVSTWVQCEDCLKWRKIPWQVDVDLLPEKFYCKDNVWNTAAGSCDVPEDEWDMEDPLVDANGKVESSPIRRRKVGSLSPLDEKNFKTGARFDVLREGKNTFCIGVVVKVDFCGKVKRVLFHFPKVDSRFDEWIEFGSERIARLNTKAPPPEPKPAKKATEKAVKKPKPLAKAAGKMTASAKGSGDTGKKPKEKEIGPCPLEEKNFTVGARFDVRREGKDGFSVGKVLAVDFAGDVKRVLFHVPKTKEIHDEWIEFGSERIARLNSKSTLPVEKAPKKPKKQAAPANKEFPSVTPSEEKNFTKEARFDVLRTGKKDFCTAIVVETDFSEERKRILFRFKSTPLKFNEWVDFGSDRIAAYKTKAPPPKKKKSVDATALPPGDRPSKKLKTSIAGEEPPSKDTKRNQEIEARPGNTTNGAQPPKCENRPELGINSALLEAVMMSEAVPNRPSDGATTMDAEENVKTENSTWQDRRTDKIDGICSSNVDTLSSPPAPPTPAPPVSLNSYELQNPSSTQTDVAAISRAAPPIASPPRIRDSVVRSILDTRQAPSTQPTLPSQMLPHPDFGNLVQSFQQQAMAASLPPALGAHNPLATALGGLPPAFQQALYMNHPPTRPFGFQSPSNSLQPFANTEAQPVVPPSQANAAQPSGFRPPDFTLNRQLPDNWNHRS